MPYLSEDTFISVAARPIADAYDSDPATDVYNMALYEHITFIVAHGTGATGTAVLTVEECTLVDGTGASPIAFKYRVGADTGAALGDLTAATSAGYTIIAGTGKLIVIEVDAAELAADSQFIRVTQTEGVDSPVTGAIIAILSNPRYSNETMPSAIV